MYIGPKKVYLLSSRLALTSIAQNKTRVEHHGK